MKRGKHDFPTPINEDDDISEAFRWLRERGLSTPVPDTPENWRRAFSPEAREDSFLSESSSIMRPADDEEAHRMKQKWDRMASLGYEYHPEVGPLGRWVKKKEEKP